MFRQIYFEQKMGKNGLGMGMGYPIFRVNQVIGVGRIKIYPTHTQYPKKSGFQGMLVIAKKRLA